MTNFCPADHAMGLELQLEELLEQQQRALTQGRRRDAEQLQAEIEQLQYELATTAELLGSGFPQPPSPELHHADRLTAAEPPRRRLTLH
ncbi:MAG: hypothetical protein KGQ66_11645 [Acidobacteriota bacterium]|nr:hypothetical protein [Acidobacteriota bacterium]